MDTKYICYCGLYCENCAVKSKIMPAGKKLLEELKKAGFEEIINYIPGGKEFWSFLIPITDGNFCISCHEGGGNPACAVRKCAQEKSLDFCALCESYPCEKMEKFFPNYPMLKNDNDFLREKGLQEWAKLQDERRVRGYAYSDEIGMSSNKT